jgi:hypothetical protein
MGREFGFKDGEGDGGLSKTLGYEKAGDAGTDDEDLDWAVFFATDNGVCHRHRCCQSLF